MATRVDPPNPSFYSLMGAPLDGGSIYIGEANKSAEDYPIATFWDAALAVPAAQPIRTIGGRPDRSGAIGRVYVNSDYSITVKDARGRLIYSGLSENPANAFESFYIIVDSLSELVNLVGYETDDVVKMTGRLVEGDGGGGEFVFITGDQSANITADPEQGIWVAPATDPTAVNGAWMRLAGNVVDPRWWGVVTGGAISQLEGLRGAYEYAVENGLPVTNLDGAVYVQTTGGASEIKLSCVPVMLSTLKIDWFSNSGTSNTLFDIDPTEGLVPIDTVVGSPAIIKGQNTLTIAAGLSLIAGDWINLQAGEDPSDSNERHWMMSTRVEGYNSGTGLLTYADSAPWTINYGAAFTTVLVYKLLCAPLGGVIDISVNYSKLAGKNVSQSVILRNVRGVTVVCSEEFEGDYGLAFGHGCADCVMQTAIATQTVTQFGLRNPRHPLGPWGSYNIRYDSLTVNQCGDAAAALAFQAEVHARGQHIGDLKFNGKFSVAPARPVIKVAGGSEVIVDRALIDADQIVRLHTTANVTGEERFKCGDLIMNAAGVEFDVRSVDGQVLIDGYTFGPLEILDFTFLAPVTTTTVFNMGRMIIAQVWVESSVLTGATITQVRCTDDTTVAIGLDKTADNIWVETALSDPFTYWTAEAGGSKVNRMDLTLKEFRVKSTPGGIFNLRVLGRKLIADYF